MNSLSYIAVGYNPYPMPWWLLVGLALILLVFWVSSLFQKAKKLDDQYDPDDPPDFPNPADDPNWDPEDWN